MSDSSSLEFASPLTSMIALFLSLSELAYEPEPLARLLGIPGQDTAGLLDAMEISGLAARKSPQKYGLGAKLRGRQVLPLLGTNLAAYTQVFNSGSLAACVVSFARGEILRFQEESLRVLDRLITAQELTAVRCAYDVVSRLLLTVKIPLPDRDFCVRFVSRGMDLQRVMQHFPWNVRHALVLYYKLRAVAFHLGDQRSLGMLDLAIGSMNINFRSLEQSALFHNVMSRGMNTVSALGDADILLQTSGLMCLYYYVEAKYTKAINCAYSALYAPQTAHDHTYERMLFTYAALSAIALGEYDVSVNILTLAINRARNRKKSLDVGSMEAILAHTCLLRGEHERALEIIEDLLRKSKNIAPTYTNLRALRSMAFYHYLRGDIFVSYQFFKHWMETNSLMGVTHGNYLAAPFVLDLLAAYSKADFDNPYALTLARELELAMASPSCLMRAVGMRVAGETRAKKNGWDDPVAGELLQASLELFRTFSAPPDMAQALMAVAHARRARGDTARASAAAQEAWKIVQQYGQPAWHAELDELLDGSRRPKDPALDPSPISLCVSLLQTMRQQYAWETDEGFFNSLLYALLATFHANRGGIAEVRKDSLRLVSGVDMSEGRLDFPAFAQIRSLLLECAASRRSCVHEHLDPAGSAADGRNQNMLILTADAEEQGLYVAFLEVDLRLNHSKVLGPDLFSLLENYLSTEISIHLRRNFALQSQRPQDPLLTQTSGQEHRLLYQSRSMHALVARVSSVACKDATVLILGESGVGKELIARRLHELSGRTGPFVGVNLASTPGELFESEFYGHEKGSFTGADQRKRGLFELADKGTLFIDEVGDIPPQMQVKLLRVLQEKQFMRVGGTRTLESDFRLVTATNRNLEDDMRNARFREDLYYRLSVVPLQIPPLRERTEDILLLADYFLQYFAVRHQSGIRSIPESMRRELLDYPWPGNVRELKNYIERFTLVSDKAEPPALPDLGRAPAVRTATTPPEQDIFARDMSLDDLQSAYFEYQYKKANGAISGPKGVCTVLGVSRTTAYNWLEKLGLNKRYSKRLVDTDPE